MTTILHPHAATADTLSAHAPVLLCLPAMGVPARYYQPLVQALARATGGPACVAELRGQGDSNERAERGADFGYREIVEDDLPRWLDQLVQHHPQRRIVLVGHSLGGQLAVLACATLAERVSALVLLAAGTAHHRAWPAPHRLRARITVSAITALARLLPWYPGRRLGFGGNQPRRLMRDWSFNAHSGRYRLEGSRHSTEAIERALRRVALPVLALNIADDPVAPAGARDELLAHLPRARVTLGDLPGDATGSAWQRHFNWVREPDDCAAHVAAWLASHALSTREAITPPPTDPTEPRGTHHVLA